MMKNSCIIPMGSEMNIFKGFDNKTDSYGDIFGGEHTEEITNCLNLLDASGRSNDPIAKLLHDALLERITQQPCEKKTIEHILGLASNGTGQTTTFTQVKEGFRNYYLWRSMKYLQQEHDCKVRYASGLLVDAMPTFLSVIFPRLQNGSRDFKNEFEENFYNAYLIDEKLPKDPNYLCDKIFSKFE